MTSQEHRPKALRHFVQRPALCAQLEVQARREKGRLSKHVLQEDLSEVFRPSAQPWKGGHLGLEGSFIVLVCQ